jgi:phytoene synthase
VPSPTRAGGIPAVARPALLAGWQTQGILTLAVRQPARVGEGTLHLSEFARRGRLLLQSLTGRF